MMSGWCSGTTMTAVPTRSLVVFAALSAPVGALAGEKAQCNQAYEQLYKLTGTAPNPEAKQTNLDKCVKADSKAKLDCIIAAKEMKDLGGCKGK